MKKNILFLLAIVFFPSQAQVSFDAEVNRKEMTVDETLEISYIIKSPDLSSINSQSFNLALPEFNGFDVLSSRQWNEEVMTNNQHSYSVIFSLILKPEKTGDIRIPAAQFSYNGKIYKSDAFIIEVNKPSDRKANSDVAGNKMKDGFLVFEVTDNSPYQNENIVGQLAFYALNPFYLENISKFTPPKFNGFKSNMIENAEIPITREPINGRYYYKRIIYQIILTPLSSGKLTIAPNEAQLIIPDGFYGQKAITIKSGKVDLAVKKLPNNAPEDFTGAVGQFTLKVKSPPSKIKAKESVHIDMELEGEGNFTMIDLPKIEVPKEMEQYKPSIKKDIDFSEKGESGILQQKTVLVPQENGNFEINIGAFSFFDPSKREYISIPEKNYSITVDGVVKNQIAQHEEEEEEIEDEDSIDNGSKMITFFQLQPDESPNYGTWAAIGGGLLLLTIGAFALLRKKKNTTVKESDATNQPANQTLATPVTASTRPSYIFNHLKNAHFTKDKEAFYDEIGQMLRRAKPHLNENEDMNSDFEHLSSLFQKQKYAPFADEKIDEELYSLSEAFYKKYFANY